MPFEYCAECQRCCHVDTGYPSLEITLTAAEIKTALINGLEVVTAIPMSDLETDAFGVLHYDPEKKIGDQMRDVLIKLADNRRKKIHY